jgi:hypothetical protein
MIQIQTQTQSTNRRNHRSRPSRIRPSIGTVTLIFVSAALQIACNGCRVEHAPTESVSQPTPPTSPARISSSARLVCPTLNSSPIQPVPAGQGGHRVILSWKASARPSSKHDAAAGYCVYRGKGDKDPSPQLLNTTPFPGTRCADDWVKNAEKYHYIVRAISAKWVLSSPSNVAHVTIPAEGQAKPSSALPAPLCRDPAATK